MVGVLEAIALDWYPTRIIWRKGLIMSITLVAIYQAKACHRTHEATFEVPEAS